MSTVSDIAGKSGVRALYWDKRLWAYCLSLFAVFIFVYMKLFVLLIGAWFNNAVYSHGFLVPFISLYLIWENKERLAAINPSPAYISGLVLLTFGLGAYLVGQTGGALILQEASLIITIAGIVLFVLGPAFLKALAFPILYLSFMLTSWGIFTERLHMPFQLFSADLGTRLLHLVGVPAYMESVYIELPNITLQVARECSGVNYLVAVSAIGIPLAYVALKSWPRRILLVVGALAIAVLANSLRVATIGVLAYYNVTRALHGPMHILHGMLVSFIGYIALFAGVWLLSEKKGNGAKTGARERPALPATRTGGKTDRYPIFITALALLFFGIFLNYFPPSPVSPKLDLRQFPDRIGEWRRLDKAPSRFLGDIGADDELLRVYGRADGKEITLYIGYFKDQAQGREMVNDQTKAFHAGSEKKDMIIIEGGRKVPVSINVQAGTGPGNDVTMFWYDLNGSVATGRVSVMALTAWNGILKGRTNGAFIAVRSAPGEGTGKVDGMEKYESSFVRALIPVVDEYI